MMLILYSMMVSGSFRFDLDSRVHVVSVSAVCSLECAIVGEVGKAMLVG